MPILSRRVLKIKEIYVIVLSISSVYFYSDIYRSRWLGGFLPLTVAKFRLVLKISDQSIIDYFSRNANGILLKLFFQGDRLECVQVHRHLDLLLSHNLSWSEYIFHSRKAYKKLRLLKNENSELEGNISQNSTYHL